MGGLEGFFLKTLVFLRSGLLLEFSPGEDWRSYAPGPISVSCLWE